MTALQNVLTKVKRRPGNVRTNVNRQKIFGRRSKMSGQMSSVRRKCPDKGKASEKNFRALERTRHEAGIPVDKLCATAGIAARNYRRLLAGDQAPQERTLRQLALALAKLDQQAPPTVVRAFVAGTTAVLAQLAGADPALVAAHDFSVQRPQDKGWLAAARLNRMAMQIAVVELDVRRGALAHALGCSRQNVHQALAWVRDQSEDPAVAGLLAQATALVTGRAAA